MARISGSQLFQRCGLAAPALPAAAGPLEFVEAAAAAQQALQGIEAALGPHPDLQADMQGALSHVQPPTGLHHTPYLRHFACLCCCCILSAIDRSGEECCCSAGTPPICG